ncbi:hypothetical protein [Massilia sp. X63]|uniref:hypothetical protein n=1 Tax=Massilia sp. X63 TaxID=3237285 RepID=UPI0034DD3A06
MPTYTTNGPGVIRKALEEAGIKFSGRDSVGASADRLRAFWLNPQAAFEKWREEQADSASGRAQRTNNEGGSNASS